MNKISAQELRSTINPTPEVVHLRQRVQELESAIQTSKQNAGKWLDAVHQIIEAVPVCDPVKMEYKPTTNKAGTPVVMVPHVTDWHIGATTLPAYVEEFGEFNWEVAKTRVASYTKKLVDKVDVIRSSYRCHECHVLGTADWVSGDIHEELSRTNEFPVPVQAVRSGFLLGGFIAGLAPYFSHVYAHILNAGNHDRITKKMQCEQGGLNSYGYIVTAIAQQYLSAIGNVSFKSYIGSSSIVTVPGMRYLIMHGDGIPAHMGVPHFGMDRLVMREALRRMNRSVDVHFDAVVCGHWHVANNLLFCRYGGSLSGTTAHDHKFARHARPHQTSWFVHPKHGEFDWTRWWL